MQITNELKNIIAIALAEDKALDDVTSDLTLPANHQIKFQINAREEIILCGIDSVKICFDLLKETKKFQTAKINYKILEKDGEVVKQGKSIVEGVGDAKLIFAFERTVLNLLQHLSGISTQTNNFVNKLNNKKTKILDTRKTLPGLRTLQKYAVEVGGGKNHRFNLSDMILIKDNHIAAAGGIENAIKLAKKNKNLKIEVECDNIEQVKKAVALMPDIIMLDNMSVKEIKEAQKIINSSIKNHAKIEISGGVNINNISDYSDLNVDFISVGVLTHSVRAVDIGLDVV